MRPAKLLGVGNPYRGDDGAGPAVIARLENRLPADRLAVCDGEIVGLMAEFETENNLILIDALDAVSAGLDPGELVTLGADDPALLDCRLRTSSHSMGVAEAVALARNLGCLPEKCLIIGIAGSEFACHPGLSEPVADAVTRLAEQLLEEFADA